MLSSQWRRFRIIIPGAIVVLAFAYVIFFPWQREIYLVMDGSGALVLKRSSTGRVKITEATMAPPSNMTAQLKDGDLVLVCALPTGGDEMQMEFRLVPAPDKRDWLLAESRPGLAPFLSPDQSGATRYELPVLFLHRIDDQRVIELFRENPNWALETTGPAAARIRALAREILDANPSDTHIRKLYLWMLLQQQDTEEIRARLKDWSVDFAQDRNPMHWKIVPLCKAHVRARDLSLAGKNGFDLVNRMIEPSTCLADRKKLARELLSIDSAVRDPVSSENELISPFLEMQVAIKALRVEGTLMLLDGKTTEALEVLAGCYRFGQFLMNDPTLVGRLIGIAARAIATGGLEIAVLNACGTAADCERAWGLLENLEKLDRSQETDLAKGTEIEGMDTSDPEQQEMVVRAKVADARFRTLRLAAAARHRLFSTRAYPASASEFAPLLPEGPPADPFTSAPLRFLSTPDLFVAYSVGPDKVDDRATIEYDPTNGTVSVGDLVTSAPRVPLYPFPAGAVRARSGADLDRQFPSGLPADPFANTRGRGLNRTNAAPVRVYSFGPDTDENEILPRIDSNVPETPYDPTNGTVSAGDIFVILSQR